MRLYQALKVGNNESGDRPRWRGVKRRAGGGVGEVEKCTRLHLADLGSHVHVCMPELTHVCCTR